MAMNKFWQPLDIVTWVVILILSLFITLVIIRGDRTTLQIDNFSWDKKQVGILDSYFQLQFNRPLQPTAIKEIKIQPPLPGKIKWQGSIITYTPLEPPVYGTKYEITILPQTEKKQELPAIKQNFQTRDRVFAFIGAVSAEKGRLVVYNLTQQKKTVLTPEDLVVTDFKVYPQGNKILFAAFDRNLKQGGVDQQQIYTVTTGLGQTTQEPIGRLKLLFDNKQYQNLEFDISSQGETIVVQRLNRTNPLEYGLWVVSGEQPPHPLGFPGSQFKISPDGKQVALVQREGVSQIAVAKGGGSTQFFPGYVKVIAFSPDGQEKLLVKYNNDYSQSLVKVTTPGQEKELLKIFGETLDCQYSPRYTEKIYCLQAEISDRNLPSPPSGYISQIDLETGFRTKIMKLPNYQGVHISLSPDGIALLFDQILAPNPNVTSDLFNEQGQQIGGARLWLLPLPEQINKKENKILIPEELIPGYKGKWLP
ncbi:MAG: hypothetical protein D6756_07415 [Cyanobacteria bacterium J083]|nr:MAG: hypothetical protein D6756_07415 [Cyanobacteria bacterium J083]